jgi:hypothetical protein
MATNLNFPFTSPAVFVQTSDISQNTSVANGTNVFFAGFSPQGPTDEPTAIPTVADYETIFGIPTTPAERQSYNAVQQLVGNSTANVTFTRMPYGSGAGIGFADQYSAIVFPIIGVSAVEVDPCDYFRQVDEENCRVNFPWLYTSYFTKSSVCVGSSNLDCPLTSNEEPGGALVIQDHPVPYNAIWTGFKFVVDADTSPEDLRVFQLRPTVNGFNTTYQVITSISLANVYTAKDEDQSHLSNDGKRLIVDLTNSVYAKTYNITSGLLSGQTLSGVAVSAGDVFATYSQNGAGVLQYLYSAPDYAGSYTTNLTVLSTLSAGLTFSEVTTAVQNVTRDYLINFCTVPVEAGLSCQTITALNLQVPEADKYNFYPLDGDAVLRDANFYVFGEPITKTLNASEYQLLANAQFNWKCGVFENVDPALDVVNNNVRAGLILVNEIKAAQLEDFSGYYVSVTDNLNVNPATDFDSLTGVSGYYQDVCPGVSGNWVNVPDERLNFAVSSIFDQNITSISQIVENASGPSFGTALYNDSVTVSLFKLRPTQYTETINKLDAVMVEKFVGSLNADRKINDPNGGPPRSDYIEKTINDGSNYMTAYVNPYLSKNNCWADNTGIPQKTVRMFREKTATVFDNFDAQAALQGFSDSLYGIGSYNGQCRDAIYDICQKKDLGNLPAKLERALMEVENPIDYPLDIIIDNGLSTMWATRTAVAADHCITDPSICYNYDDTYFVDTNSLSPFDGTTMNSDIQQSWEVIVNIIDSFCKNTRQAAGDVGVYSIVDPLRQIFVNGPDYKVVSRQNQVLLDPTTNQPTDRYATFSRNIYAYLRNLYSGFNSNYSESHANWVKGLDSASGNLCWYPVSPYKASLFARNDANQFPWTAALGVANGYIPNITDLAINPNQRERDLLSNINLNPVVKFPEGNLVWNTLTLQTENTALRENYIRRGLLWLGKSAQTTLRPFIGQPNTVVTRTRVKNALQPLLDFMENNSGLYDYMIVCDERNNTAATIDAYQLNVAVYVKPVKTTKFILLDITVTNTSVDFNTLL